MPDDVASVLGIFEFVENTPINEHKIADHLCHLCIIYWYGSVVVCGGSDWVNKC